MISKVRTCTIIGLEVYDVLVEIDIRGGLPKLEIIGLPGKTVSEAKERVISAIINSGYEMPSSHIVVSLAPADLAKNGNNFDLPIAIGILVASEQLKQSQVENKYFIGELLLNGDITNVGGVLPITQYIESRKKVHGEDRELFFPHQNENEAKLVSSVTSYPTNNLKQLIDHLNNLKNIERTNPLHVESVLSTFVSKFDFTHIRGQAHTKKGLEISAAGSHNLLMIGTPGSGKSMMAKTYPSILPRLTVEECLEITRIYSVAGLVPKNELIISERPFRKPHHTSSHTSIVGGGAIPKPGEITLAHRGVLFLDEFVEFSSQCIESLRQPLEDRIVTISRASGSYTYPANFSLIAAMNPCKCGWKGDKLKKCICTERDVIRYNRRLSGPILDRFDLQVWVDRVEVSELMDKSQSESSKHIQERVQRARDIQLERFKSLALDILSNSEISSNNIDEVLKIDILGTCSYIS